MKEPRTVSTTADIPTQKRWTQFQGYRQENIGYSDQTYRQLRLHTTQNS